MSSDGGFAAVPVVVKKLLAFVDVSGGDEDEVRDSVDVVEFGLAVPVLAVVDQPAHPTRLFGGVHTARRETGQTVTRSYTLKEPRCGFILVWSLMPFIVLFASQTASKQELLKIQTKKTS